MLIFSFNLDILTTPTGIVTHLWRVKFDMIRASAARMEETTGDSTHKQLIINLEFNHTVQRRFAFLQQRVQLLSLDSSTRESVQNESLNIQIWKFE